MKNLSTRTKRWILCLTTVCMTMLYAVDKCYWLDNIIYVAAILYVILGFLIVTATCRSGKVKLIELLSKYDKPNLIELMEDGRFNVRTLIYICCGIFLIYMGGHFFAMSIFSVLIINKTVKYIVDKEAVKMLWEMSSELPTE
jgi:hypothetical protein